VRSVQRMAPGGRWTKLEAAPTVGSARWRRGGRILDCSGNAAWSPRVQTNLATAGALLATGDAVRRLDSACARAGRK
jgi:hypothetical protein